MLVMVLQSIRSELDFAYGDTGLSEFKKAIDHLNEAISLTESMDLGGAASERIGRAVSAATTAAQAAWETLNEHELL
ncbi:hypothetical protein [Methanoculleus chikugoensis]|uniref:hypothetical protein n=1 Tax=Methanoculleus chikugoensis TaxID=118126 RepID=UPI001FB48B3E|nr:hypothetical protein [Methanoculleus chikugoensis]